MNASKWRPTRFELVTYTQKANGFETQCADAQSPGKKSAPLYLDEKLFTQEQLETIHAAQEILETVHEAEHDRMLAAPVAEVDVVALRAEAEALERAIAEKRKALKEATQEKSDG